MKQVDWSQRGEYILARHEVSVDEAVEAVDDPDVLTIVPDPASKKGQGVRHIGWSHIAGCLITVITVDHEGVTYGANAWHSNSTDIRRYREEPR